MSAAHLPATVLTARLRLPLVTPAQATDLGTGSRHPSFAPGFPRPDDLAAVSLVRDTDPATMSWGPRLVVRAHDGLVCGTIGFFGPPAAVGQAEGDAVETPGSAAPVEAEIGFGLVDQARGRGVATEALQALLAEADRCEVLVRARVQPSNAPCVKVLSKTGFIDLRGGDEDGNLVMGRPAGGHR